MDRAREIELVERCRQGDEAAWRELYRAHAPAVRRYLAGMVGAREDLEDLIQGVFMTSLRNLDRFEHRSKLRTWLIGIAHRTALTAARSDRRRRRFKAAFERAMSIVHQGGTHSAMNRAIARSDLEVVSGALEDMSTKLREVWTLREVVGLSVAEVSEAIQLAPGSVRARHSRARAFLDQRLQSRPAERRSAASELDCASGRPA